MASKNIKGITIEIGGNTTKLQNALKDVDSVVYKTNTELKSLNQALKLDPKNTELLAQKQDVLKKMEAPKELIKKAKKEKNKTKMKRYLKLFVFILLVYMVYLN